MEKSLIGKYIFFIAKIKLIDGSKTVLNRVLAQILSLESYKRVGKEETHIDFVKLFDGNLDGWKMIGNGSFEIIFEDIDDKKPHPYL